MDSGWVSVIVAIVAVASNIVTTFVALYVKGAIAPISERARANSAALSEIRTEQRDQWEHIGANSERIARVEACGPPRRAAKGGS